jgi:hypothetical protein
VEPGHPHALIVGAFAAALNPHLRGGGRRFVRMSRQVYLLSTPSFLLM